MKIYYSSKVHRKYTLEISKVRLKYSRNFRQKFVAMDPSYNLEFCVFSGVFKHSQDYKPLKNINLLSMAIIRLFLLKIPICNPSETSDKYVSDEFQTDIVYSRVYLDGYPTKVVYSDEYPT